MRNKLTVSNWGLRLSLLPTLLVLVAIIVVLNQSLRWISQAFGREDQADTLDRSPSLSWVLRLFTDTTEAQFYGSALAGAGMIILAGFAHYLAVRRSRWQGFEISYGTGLWLWLLAAAVISLILSNLLWGWTYSFNEWQPTFVPFVSVAPAIVIIYGPGWRVAFSAAVLGAILTTPIAIGVVNFVGPPLGLPNVVGNVTGMWAGALLAFWISRYLPWMNKPLEPPPEEDARVESNKETADTASDAQSAARKISWLPRRALADFTEPQFYGNEWASIGLIGGVLLAWGAGVFGFSEISAQIPDILTAQLLTACLAVWLYANKWASQGWYPTFVPIVSLVPASVIEFGGGWSVIITSAVIGAVAGPWIARSIAQRLPPDFHPFIGSVMSMTIISAVGIPILRMIL